MTLATNAANASKGEGIAGTPRYLAPATITTTTTATDTTVEGFPNGSYARGAPANAGGGGTDGHPVNNDYNSGGGAGANGGVGGLGGYGWNSFTALNSTDGGFGGAAFPASTSALVMGGAGGAGTTNDGSYYITGTNHGADCGTTCTGIYSSGGAGGGIVIVHTGSVVGTGTITSNGQSTLSTDNDSTGGGGAGGSILFFANSGTLSGLTVSANGGSAGNAWPEEAPGGFPGQRHGPGGGGGGGVILLSGTPDSDQRFGWQQRLHRYGSRLLRRNARSTRFCADDKRDYGDARNASGRLLRGSRSGGHEFRKSAGCRAGRKHYLYANSNEQWPA